MKQVLLVALLFALGIGRPALAQTCKVEDVDIAREYSGDCKDGFADGFGVAKGRDEYRGMFKQGKKHGTGTYQWADGSRFEGEFEQDRYATGFGVFTEPLSIHNPSKKTSPVKGRIVGDVYVEKGWWVRSRLVVDCDSREMCRQALELRESQRVARDDVAQRNVNTRACADATEGQVAATANDLYLGVWSGKWDGKWEVVFSVAAGSRVGTLLVTYEWEEYAKEPLHKQLHSACVKGGYLVIDAGYLELRLPGESSQVAMLVGKFEKTRTTELRKR